GTVKWWFEPADKAEVMDTMIKRIERLISEQSVPLSDICCLFRTNADASALSAELLKRKIPVTSEESLLLKNNPSVMLIVATIKSMTSGNDAFLNQFLLSRYQRVFPLSNYHQTATALKKDRWTTRQLLKQLGVKFNPAELQHGD